MPLCVEDVAAGHALRRSASAGNLSSRSRGQRQAEVGDESPARPSRALVPTLQRRSFCSQKREGTGSHRFGHDSRTVCAAHWVGSGADAHLRMTETSAPATLEACSSPWRQTTPSEGVPGARGAVAKSTPLRAGVRAAGLPPPSEHGRVAERAGALQQPLDPVRVCRGRQRLSVSFREGRRTGRGRVAAVAGGGAHGPSASPHRSRGWTKSAAPRAEWDGIFILQQ